MSPSPAMPGAYRRKTGYWYQRCRRPLREQVSTQDDLHEIAAALEGRQGT